MGTRTFVGVVLILGWVGLSMIRAWGQARDPTYVEVRQKDIEPGSRVTIRGGGWQPGTRVRFFLSEQRLGDATVRSNGFFDSAVQVPEFDEGEYRLVVRGTAEGDPHSYAVPITLQEGPVVGLVSLIIVGILALIGLSLAWLFINRVGARRSEH